MTDINRTYSLRSLGMPYFAAVQNDLSFMDAGNAPEFDAGGSNILYLDFALHALPTQLASPTEIHRLISYHEEGPTGRELFYLGVTPQGAVGAYHVGTNATLLTNPGLLVPDGVFRKLRAVDLGGHLGIEWWDWYPDGAGGYFSEQAGAEIAFVVGSAWVTEGPSGGRLGQLMLFNGKEGKTRVDCSIRYAQMDSLLYSPRWAFDDREGSTLAGSVDPGQQFNTNLSLGYYDPLFAYPWGAMPTTDPGAAYRWDLATEWTKRALPATVWAKRAT